MKRKSLVVISIIIVLVSGLFILTGCGNNSENNGSNNSSNEISKDTKTEIKKTISSFKEGHLFKSKKSVEHVMYLNEDNKLIKYEHIEKYYDFTDDNDYKMIAEGAPDEAELNNKTYKYLNETVDIKTDPKEVTITDTYEISKLEAKKQLPSDELEDSLDDNYIMNIENYKKTMTDKGYTFTENS